MTVRAATAFARLAAPSAQHFPGWGSSLALRWGPLRLRRKRFFQRFFRAESYPLG